MSIFSAKVPLQISDFLVPPPWQKFWLRPVFFFALCKPKGSRANEMRSVFARVQREIFEESDKNPAF